MNFQLIIVALLIVILIIMLTMIGLALKNGGTSSERIIPTCPDYWTLDASGLCVNSRDLGKCPVQAGNKHLTMDFSQAPFVGSDGICNKYTWANKCGIAWENLTYGISKSPCDTL